MSYPAHCLRGVSLKDAITEDGIIAPHAFFFHEGDKRQDGWIEQSINWEDDEKAVPFTLAQKRVDGTAQFPYGLAVVPRVELDRLCTQVTVAGRLAYERRVTEGYAYHGNLLLKSNTPKVTMKMIAAGIALHVSRIVPPPAKG
jgi:hypothetical protein